MSRSGLRGDSRSTWAKRNVRIVTERVDAVLPEELRPRYVTAFDERWARDVRSAVPASLAERQRTRIRNEDGT